MREGENMPFMDKAEIWFTRFEWRIVTGLVTILALRLWISPLPSSLWLDETGAWWASGGSFADWAEAMKTTQFPQSPLYTLVLWLVAQITGFNEVLLRLPSVAAMTAATVLLYRVGRILFGPMPAIYSLLLWISLGNVSFTAADVRPYAIGLLSVVFSAYTFLRWLQTGKLYLVIANGIATAIMIYCSYYFGAILIAQGVFVLFGHSRHWLRMRPVLLISPVLTGMLLLPVIPIVRSISAAAYMHVLSGMPSWTDLGLAWMPPRWIVAATVATAILALLRPGRIQFAAPETERSSPLGLSAALHWLALLAVTPALLLFLYSYISKHAAFQSRYFLSMTPGLAVLGAYMVYCFKPAMWRGLFAVTLFFISIITSGTQLWTRHQTDDWRSASAFLGRIRREEPGVMILAASSFVESEFLPLSVDAAQKRWLLAPQYAYPIPGPLELLPLLLGPANELDVRRVMNKAAEQDHFLIIWPGSTPLMHWTYGRFLEDYHSVVVHEHPPVVRYERRIGK
jgi:hypothetical protein